MNTDFSKYINGERLTFKYAEGSGALTGKEFHEYHEILFILNGTSEFFSDRIHSTLSSGTIVIIPKESYHQFILKSEQKDYRRCVFNFIDSPEIAPLSKNVVPQISLKRITPEIKFLLDKLISVANSNRTDEEKVILMNSVFSLILDVLCSSFDTQSTRVKNQSLITEHCIEYINKNLCSDVSIEQLSKRLNISTSTLTHAFKQDMNISIYRYILKKRLVLAQQKINGGEPAQKVALECGFNDYSGFYKQYKKMFGVSPSGKSKRF